MINQSNVMPAGTPDPSGPIHTSVVLQQLLDEAQSDHVTLRWLMGRLRRRSYGMIMLVLALIATVPGVCIVAGLLLMIPAFEMISGQPAPRFPRRIADHPLPTRRLAGLLHRAIPVLKYLERMAHPRWSAMIETAKRPVGAIVVTLSTVMVIAPIPLTNVVPAVVIALMLAYLEEDGLVLSIGLFAAFVVLTVAGVAVWEMALGVKWLSGD